MTRTVSSTILSACFALGLSSVGELHACLTLAEPQKQSTPEAQSPEHVQTAQEAQAEEEPESEELSPASVHLDTSSFSPLILALYQATREIKEKPTLAKLADIRELIEKDSDLKSVDSAGRTALHWAVMGSSHATKPGVLTAYT